MSIKLMNGAWSLDLPSGQKFVLISLCDQSNDDGYCWPSIDTISKRCGLCERTVQSHLSDLCEQGYIEKSFRNGRSTVYQIDPRKICTPEKSAPTPADIAPPPPQNLHPTPADIAPRTISEPSIEPSRNRRAARASQLPDDFRPNAACAELATQLGIIAAEELPKFRDYHTAKGSTMKDWQAAFRTWLRNSQKWGNGSAKRFVDSREEGRALAYKTIREFGKPQLFGDIIDADTTTAKLG